MNTHTIEALHVGDVPDAELVMHALDGRTDAFGRLVERHQSLVCSLALGVCGDLHGSEDIAQETFVRAWRQLKELREPAMFKPWICGITRNVANSTLRKEARSPLASDGGNALGAEPREDSPGPSEHAIDSEERAILLRQLLEMPALYREPMVLFYRKDKSVASVAEALGLSEDAVKQRLSRGRVMLAERVEHSLGSVLRSTAPTTAFTLSVLGTLAASTAKASPPAIIGAGAKMVKGMALTATIAALIVTGVTGMWILLRSQTQSACTPRERRFAAKALVIATLLCFAMPLSFGLIFWLKFGLKGIQIMVPSSWSVAFCCLIGALVESAAFVFGFWFYRRRERIRLEDGMTVEWARSVWRMEPADKGFWPCVIGLGLGLGSIYNLPLILVVFAWKRTLVIAMPLVLAGMAIMAMTRWPREWRRVFMALIGALFAQYAVLTASFWQQWSQSKEVWQHSFVIVSIQSLYLGIWGVTVIGCYLYWRSVKWGLVYGAAVGSTNDAVWH